MRFDPERHVARALAALRARGEPMSLAELAAELLSLRTPPAAAIARRVVAAALGAQSDALVDPLDLRHLCMSSLGSGVDRTGGRESPAGLAQVPALSLDAAEFVVVDLETTGLSPRVATILEIGAVRVDARGELDRFTTLVHPGVPIPASIRALTGIDDRMVAGAPRLAQALPEFLRWLDQSPGAPLVAHNASFDAGFIARALERLGLPAHGRQVFCSRRLAKRVLPEARRLSLAHLICHLGIVNAAPHRALGDAEATARVWLRLLDLAWERAGVSTLADLLALDRSRPAAVHATLRLPEGPPRHLTLDPLPA